MVNRSFGPTDDSDAGLRLVRRISAEYNGHTHLYQYSEDDTLEAIRMIRLHVEEGQLHPYAGLLLIRMAKRGE